MLWLKLDVMTVIVKRTTKVRVATVKPLQISMGHSTNALCVQKCLCMQKIACGKTQHSLVNFIVESGSVTTQARSTHAAIHEAMAPVHIHCNGGCPKATK